MTGNDIRSLYLRYFEQHDHKEIPAAPIVPLNDPSTLFTPFGMQQLVPYLKGELHPMGQRVVDSQPCFRSEDISEVGDNRHTTFFEMLGNWSLGDYFKKEQLPWIFKFVTNVVSLDPNRLYVTVFEGDNSIPPDTDSVKIWQTLFKTEAPAKHGLDGFDPKTKIYSYDAKKNWWSRAGVPNHMPVGEIGGPDSEMFFDFDPDSKLHLHEQSKITGPCHVNCDCGRFMEIGNSVFMQYLKTDHGFEPLPKQNVDFGGGLERLAAAANGNRDVFTTDLFARIINAVSIATGQSYETKDKQPAMRVVADHLKAATFLIAGGITPSNKLQGYFLRRLLRRVVVKMQQLHGDIREVVADSSYEAVINAIIDTYTPLYFKPDFDRLTIISIVREERAKFTKTLTHGLQLIARQPAEEIDGKFAFDLYQSYGFPIEITEELVIERGVELNQAQFKAEYEKHRERSRSSSQGIFKGGLADHSDIIVKFHTLTHLLHASLRQVLGDHVQQMGSNLTAERLRFDFKHPQKLTPEELTAVETLINQKISENLPVHKEIVAKEVALKSGAMAFFREKYPDQVSVYTIGQDKDSAWFSKEICGGPHVASTGVIGTVKMKKEEAVGAGVRRIYMVLTSG